MRVHGERSCVGCAQAGAGVWRVLLTRTVWQWQTSYASSACRSESESDTWGVFADQSAARSASWPIDKLVALVKRTLMMYCRARQALQHHLLHCSNCSVMPRTCNANNNIAKVGSCRLVLAA